MNKFKLILLSACIIITSASASEAFTGNDLLYSCTSDHLGELGKCYGVMIATNTALELGAAQAVIYTGYSVYKPQAEVILGYCFPKKATIGQIKDIAVNYLQKNPQLRHLDAILLLHEALVESFPCVPKR